MTFTVTSGDSSVVRASVSGSTLRLELPSYKLGEDIGLTVVATDATGLSKSQLILVDVVNTPDPPTVDGSLGPIINANEDTVIVRTLSDVFTDPRQRHAGLQRCSIGQPDQSDASADCRPSVGQVDPVHRRSDANLAAAQPSIRNG